MRAWTCALGLLVLAPGALAYDLVGSENCSLCHPTAFAAWKDTPHARANRSLTGRWGKDARCLTCHSPEASRGASGVQCETCHGGGQYYSVPYVMRDAELARAAGLLDPTEAMCLKCHDASAPSLRPFTFKDKLKDLDHWSSLRAARKAATAKPATPPPKAPAKPKAGGP